MAKIFTKNEAEIFAKTGARVFRHGPELKPEDAAIDVLVAAGIRLILDPALAGTTPLATNAVPTNDFTADENLARLTATGRSTRNFCPSPADQSGYKKADIDYFNSPECEALKYQMCDIGRRIWMREYVDGNGGNITARVDGDRYLCTPTGVSKGFLTPDMIGMVDATGKQIAGTWKRTSEVNTHIAIMKAAPAAMSVIHAHPVHATAFAVAGVEPPTCLLTESEIFLGRIPIAKYATPGSPDVAKFCAELAPEHQAILMASHGVIVWGTGVEDAYYKMEIADTLCRTIIIANQLPKRGEPITNEGMSEILDLKKIMGLPDDRFGLEKSKLCPSNPWDSIDTKK
ncbi:MAG: class II aldolase/adducin family protein [Opitutae bacterium]|nr:class II aldolase/adducin family protein [Opitutae bacterium]MCD8299332.1 class II aldolase/adducin family protein [Opitutae bacterium]